MDAPGSSIEAPEKPLDSEAEDVANKPDGDAGIERRHRRRHRKKRKKELAKFQGMFFNDGLVSRKDKHNLYYLLPGMGSGARKRFVRNIIVAVIVGLLVSGCIGLAAYYMSR